MNVYTHLCLELMLYNQHYERNTEAKTLNYTYIACIFRSDDGQYFRTSLVPGPLDTDADADAGAGAIITVRTNWIAHDVRVGMTE